MIAECLGCKNYIRTIESIGITCLIEFSHACPCPHCVVKVICELACPEFKVFREKYHTRVSCRWYS